MTGGRSARLVAISQENSARAATNRFVQRIAQIDGGPRLLVGECELAQRFHDRRDPVEAAIGAIEREWHVRAST